MQACWPWSLCFCWDSWPRLLDSCRLCCSLRESREHWPTYRCCYSNYFHSGHHCHFPTFELMCRCKPNFSPISDYQTCERELLSDSFWNLDSHYLNPQVVGQHGGLCAGACHLQVQGHQQWWGKYKLLKFPEQKKLRDMDNTTRKHCDNKKER